MKLISNQKGQSLIEYLIIVALVGIGAMGVMKAVGQNVSVQFARIAKALGGQVDGAPKAAAVTENMYKKKDLSNFMSGAVNNKSNDKNND